jgi:hypothetical protein
MLKKHHKQKGFPKNTILPQGKYLLTYSKHAQKEFALDKYNKTNLMLPIIIDIQAQAIFEIEMEDYSKSENPRKPNKIVCRISLNETTDLNLAIIWQDKCVKTVWLNEKNDKHDTLDLSKYHRAY